MTTKIPVIHIITRLAIGGAQENTILTVSLTRKDIFYSMIISGSEKYPEGNLLEEVARRNIPHHVNKFLIRPINLIMDTFCMLSLIRGITKMKGLIVHTHSSKAGILGRCAAKVAGSRIIIHTVHGWSFNDWMPKPKRSLYVFLERFAAKYSDRIICVTKRDIEKGLKEKIGERRQYVVIRSGFDVGIFRNRNRSVEEIKRELGIPPGKMVVGTVGRFSVQKDLGTFVRVAEQVCKKRNDVVFAIVGDGELRSEIENLVSRCGLEKKVLLLGAHRNVERIFWTFDVFLLTSLWEGLPKVIPQAMASGVPVVATAVDGVKEIVQHEENGLLSQPKDVKRLVDHTMAFIDNPKLRDEVVRNAREVVDEFDAKIMVARIENLYRGLLPGIRKSL
jgi:glycosyltransferase involved in cell wall biosynthesis